MTRQVALSDDAYELLKALRLPAESFSDVVRRLGERARRDALMKLAGSWKISEAEAKRITDQVYARRKEGRFRKVEL